MNSEKRVGNVMFLFFNIKGNVGPCQGLNRCNPALIFQSLTATASPASVSSEGNSVRKALGHQTDTAHFQPLLYLLTAKN